MCEDHFRAGLSERCFDAVIAILRCGSYLVGGHVICTLRRGKTMRSAAEPLCRRRADETGWYRGL